MKTLICNDIIGTIKANEAANNITRSEGRKLRRMTLQLYQHIYQDFKEMEESGMNEIAEEALILDIDIIEYEHKKELDSLEHEYKKKLEAQDEAYRQETERQRQELKAQKQELKERIMEADNQLKVNIALKMLLRGEPDSKIMEASGLSQMELNQLKDS